MSHLMHDPSTRLVILIYLTQFGRIVRSIRFLLYRLINYVRQIGPIQDFQITRLVNSFYERSRIQFIAFDN